jgi:hypothetical protein
VTGTKTSQVQGALAFITDATAFAAATGILAARSYQAGLNRTVLYRKGITNPASMLIENAGKISALRRSLDSTNSDDEGVASPDGGVTSNIIPADSNAIAFSRTAKQVLKVLYLNGSASVGGFFPAGVNGNIT